MIFFPSQWVIPWDLRYYHYPLERWMSDAFRRWELPLWDPFVYCGYPIGSDVTLQLFYPPNTLMVFLATWIDGGKHLFYALELEVIAHVWLGGVLMHRLLRRLGLGEWPALAGATVFALGPFFASQPQHIGAICAAAWMPLAFEAVFDRSPVKLGIALAMSMLSGFPAVTAMTAVACIHLALALAVVKRAEVRTFSTLAIGGALAAALAAVALLPAIELTGLSVAKYRSDWLRTGGGAPLEALVSLVNPNHYGQFTFDSMTWKQPWNFTWSHLYLGLGGLSCAIAGAFRIRHRLALVFAMLTAGSLLWFLGDKTPAGRLVFELVPAALRNPFYAEYALPYFSLSAAALAALGFERLTRKRRPAIVVACLALLATDLILVSSGRPMNAMSLAKEPGNDYSHMDGLPEIPNTVRALTGAADPPWRVDTMRGSINWSSLATLVRVPTASGNLPFAPERVMRVRSLLCDVERWGRWCQITRPASTVVDLLGVRYVITQVRIDEEMSRAGLRYVASIPGQEVYENPQAMPRFWFAPRTVEVRTIEEALGVMTESTAAVDGQARGGSGTVRILEYAPNRVRLQTDSPSGGLLASSETHYPGWRATIDNRAAPILYANAAFRGIDVPAGRHTIEMRYLPRTMLWGAAISAIAWLALALSKMKKRGVLGSSQGVG